jgi:DNA-binding XRE family transcriptional regulator
VFALAGYKRPTKRRIYPANKRRGKSQDAKVSAKAEPPHVIVARNISRLRYERELTQEKVCELADVDRGYFQQVEAGRQNMTIEYLDRMRKALKCRWADLFRGLDKE